MRPSIIIPTLGRTRRLSGLFRNIFDTTRAPYEIVVVSDDPDTIDMIRTEYAGLVELVEFSGDAIQAWNAGAAQATGDWFVPMDDDALFLPGWLDVVEATPNQGFVGLYEGYDVDFIGHWAISRAVCLAVLGGVMMVPHYRSWWNDWEVSRHVQRAGLYAVTREAVMVHNHYTLGRSEFDATYERGNARHADDERTYQRRQAEGFPVDWQPIIKSG